MLSPLAVLVGAVVVAEHDANWGEFVGEALGEGRTAFIREQAARAGLDVAGAVAMPEFSGPMTLSPELKALISSNPKCSFEEFTAAAVAQAGG